MSVHEKLIEYILLMREDLINRMDFLILKDSEIMSLLTDLQDEVTRVVSAEQSAVILIQGLTDQLKAAQASATPVQAVQDLIAQLESATGPLASAVAANTPAVAVVPDPIPVVDPTPVPDVGVTIDGNPVAVVADTGVAPV